MASRSKLKDDLTVVVDWIMFGYIPSTKNGRNGALWKKVNQMK
jgi:hypothetical protein